MKTKLFFCADSAAIDARTNSLSAFHIIEEGLAASFPIVVPRIAVIASLHREPEDPETGSFLLQGRIGDQSIFRVPIQPTFSNRLSTRVVADINGIVIPSPGTLSISLIFNENEVAKWDMQFTQINLPTTQVFSGGNTPIPTETIASATA